MPTRQTPFVPFVEVTSQYLNGVQDATLMQRAPGPANTMAPGLDNPSPLYQAKVLGFTASGRFTPPISGLLDASFDWRDRHIEIQLAFDPVRDIRWGHADDDKQPEYEWNFHWYSLLGGRQILVDPRLSIGLYVSLVSGAMSLFCARDGFIRAQVRGSVQLKERNP